MITLHIFCTSQWLRYLAIITVRILRKFFWQLVIVLNAYISTFLTQFNPPRSSKFETYQTPTKSQYL